MTVTSDSVTNWELVYMSHLNAVTLGLIYMCHCANDRFQMAQTAVHCCKWLCGKCNTLKVVLCSALRIILWVSDILIDYLCQAQSGCTWYSKMTCSSSVPEKLQTKETFSPVRTGIIEMFDCTSVVLSLKMQLTVILTLCLCTLFYMWKWQL